MDRKGVVAGLVIMMAGVCQAIPFNWNDGNYTLSLNNEWKFRLADENQTDLIAEFYKPDFDDSGWSSVTVPSNWEILGFEEPHYDRPDPTKTGLYRKQITVPPHWKDRQVFIDFEGISFGYTVYVNGKRVGSFQHAFLPCQFDLTEHIQYDEPNIIAIKVYRNSEESSFDCNDAWALSGIYRDAFLFSPQRYHVDRYTIQTKLDIPEQAAVIEGNVEIRLFRHNHNSQYLDHRELLRPLALQLVLKDAEEKILIDQTEAVKWLTTRVVPSHAFKIPVANAQYWSAENPYLYDLTMTLLVDGEPSHVVSQKVGLREVTIEDSVLKINGQPVKLRGVCRHEIQPEVGRALREQHWLQDIRLIKAANINAVRCSHYPPHPRFLELCDQYGLYVLDEVPIGFGESVQNDPVMLGAMLSRAERTVARDRNHPSVIIWDIGNENPLYGLQETAARHVKLLDPTRPLLYPGENFVGLNRSYASGSAEFVDIIAPHYPHNEEIKADMENQAIQKPIIFTEINHALDLAFSDFGAKWKMIEDTDKMAGAMIWLWADQGILRKVNGRPVIDSYVDLSPKKKHLGLSGDVWLDDNTILDSHGQYGTDGIVYADRRLQTDYFETRKIYSPVVIPQEFITVGADGKIPLTIKNRYDFTNLNRLKGSWKFLVNGKAFKEGQLSLECVPHESQTIALEIGLLKIAPSDLRLQVEFTDGKGTPVYERTLTFEKGAVDWLAEMEKEDRDILLHNQWYAVDDKGMLVIRNAEGASLIQGPYARIGRKPTMAERITYPRMELTIWEPAVLTQFEVLNRSETKQGDAVVIKVESRYTNPQNKDQTVKADITYTVNAAGWIDVNYTLTPESKEGALLELGLEWEVPKAERVDWLGQGPYPSYPYKSELAEHGIYSMTPDDPFFAGNRMDVQLVKVTGSDGQVGIAADPSHIGWEKGDTADNVLLYQNLKVASLGTKFKLPRQVLKTQDLGSVKGHLRLVVLPDGEPGCFREIFGESDK